MRIGIRREDKRFWKRRALITPDGVRTLAQRNRLDTEAQPSRVRIFNDAEYRRLLELGCQSIDYEKVTDDRGRRRIFFGRYAGLAGMINTLWALGQRLDWEHIATLRVIGDIGCDVEGAIERTVKPTDPGNPVYVYDPATATDGVAGNGLVVMAVDILPTGLPREALADFSAVLAPYVPAITGADYSAPFEALALPPEIKRALISHRGELTPDYRYLQGCLGV